MLNKTRVTQLAALGGKPLFDCPKSTSSLEPPDFDRFMEYCRLMYRDSRDNVSLDLISEFERRLAEFHETRYCVSFCSGFWALALCIKSLAIPGKSEVVMPSLTYRRMADVAAWTGLTPHFCEVNETSLAADADTIAAQINESTAMILAVHPIVNCCDAEGIEAMARSKGLPVLFDAVESMYETVSGRRVGSFGAAECFSMHASKLLNGFEGGYVTTNDANLADRLRSMRPSSQTSSHYSEGMSAEIHPVHAAMGLAGLDRISTQIEDNRKRYYAYRAGLADLSGVRLLEFDENEKSGFKNIVAELTDDWPLSRDMTVAILNAENILARAYYSPALHQKKAEYKTICPSLPVTERLAARFLNLPCGHFVDEADIEAINQLLLFIHEHADQIKAELSNHGRR